MKESYYFRHDYNAHEDPKIIRLQAKHGLEGYGVFWYLIELLASETGRLFLPRDYEMLAFAMRSHCDLIKSVIEDFGLFQFDEENFWNNRLDSDNDERTKKSEKAKINAEARWVKQRNKAKKMQTQCDRNANAMRPQCLREDRIGEERKGKNNIDNTITASAEKNESLELLIAHWNNNFKKKIPSKNRTIAIGENIFKPCKGTTKPLIEAYNKLLKQISDQDIRQAVFNYAVERNTRESDGNDYATHCFSFFDFLKQANGAIKFLNR